MTVEAFNLAETYRTPVILLLDEVVGHMRERFVIPEPGEVEVVDRLYTSVPRDVNYHPYLPREDGRLPMSDFGGVHRYNVTGLFHDMWGFPTTDPKTAYDLLHHLVDKLENRADVMARYREYHTDKADILLISYGSSARSSLHLVEERFKKGVKIGLLELQSLWPFPRQLIRRQCEGRSHVLVVEMNMGQVYEEVKKVAPDPDRIFLANKFDGVFISPADIMHVLTVVTGKGV